MIEDLYTKKGFYPDFIDTDSSFEKIYFIKKYWDTSWGLTASPISMIGNVLALLTFLKVFGLWKPWIFIPLLIILFIMFIWLGVYIHKKGWVQRMASIDLRFNPPIQEIIRNTKK